MKTNMPKLRFPEFRKAPEWEEKRLEAFADLYKGKGISKADISPDGQIQCIRYGELYTSYGEIIETVLSATNLPASELFFSKRNDVILPSSGETKEDISTASCVMLDDIALGGDLNVIRCDQCGKFISYYLNGQKKKEIAKIAQGDTVVHLYVKQLKQLEIALPKPLEQQKIADCLSSLDELIFTESRKLDALASYKKGLMQQLFPAEGETVPKLRFPEFRNASPWAIKKLENVFDERIQKNHPEKNVLAATQDRGVIFSDQLERSIIRDKKNLKGYKVVCPGDFVISLRSFEGGFEYASVEGIISPAYVILLAKVPICSEFFMYYFKSSSFISAIQATLNNSLRDGKSISYLQASELKLFIPVEILEQQKIADCLASLDELIAVQTEKLDGLKNFKKGMLQQLFPAVDEVSV